MPKKLNVSAIRLLLLSVAVFASGQNGWAQISITLDYSLDTTGFFADPQRRDALDYAASHLVRYTDPLSSLIPPPGSNWETVFTHPSNQSFLLSSGSELLIGQDEVRVFVGAMAHASNVLALTFPVFTFVDGSEEWKSTVLERGQPNAAGPDATDFGPWGGSVSFSNNDNINWYFGLDSEGISPDQYDFFSVAVHELATILGFGPAASFKNQIFNGGFTGQEALAVGSSNNPLLEITPGFRLADGTLSEHLGEPQVANMSATFLPGERRYLTDLDRAILRDIGWEEALPGDINRDGIVDETDWILFQSAASLGQGEGFGWSSGDFDGDGRVSLYDAYLLFKNYGIEGNYTLLSEEAKLFSLDAGFTFPETFDSFMALAIPEPVAGGILLLGSLTLLRRRSA